MEMHEYLDALKDQIRCVKARDYAAEEVENHIKDQARAYQKEGIEEAEAVARAVRQMGDPVEVGVELDRIHRPCMDWKLVAFAGILSIAGLAIQYAFGMEQADLGLFFRQCLYTGIGILLMAAVCFVDYSIIGKYAFVLWGILSGFVLLVVLFGPTLNGSYLYIRNYIYLYVPVFAGILYHYRNGGAGALIKCGLFHLVSMMIAMTAVTVPVCLDVTVICLLMTSAAIWKQWFAVKRRSALAGLWLTAILLPVLMVGIGMITMLPYQIARVEAMINPSADPYGAGYVPAMIRETLQKSVWIGKAPFQMQGRPESVHTDYVLIQLISGYGLLAAAGVLSVIAGFVIHIFHISLRQKNQLGQVLGMGCCLVFALQTLHYVMLNLGVGIVTTGMPFLSYGRSPVLVTSVLVGLLLSIYRYKNIVHERKSSYRGRYRIRIEKI